MFRQLANPRARPVLALALLIVIGLGLASRKFASALPEVIAANAGDALWTVAVYLTFAIAFPRCSPVRLGLVAFGISVAVECSQLVQFGWLNTARKTLPGRLLLGAGFLWADLARYLLGALLATFADLLWTRRLR
jgi:hypothetical protein